MVLTITTGRYDIFLTMIFSQNLLFCNKFSKIGILQLSWHAYAKCHALLSLLPLISRFVKMTKQTQLVYWPKQTRSLLGSHFVPVHLGTPSTTTLYIGGKANVNWGNQRQLSDAISRQDKSSGWLEAVILSWCENAHGNTRTGKEENDDACRPTKSISSRGKWCHPRWANKRKVIP